jgi:methyltransferase
MAALGWRWNTRVYVLPQAPLVATGPYRFLRHPIYVGVALELAGFPLMLGLWGTLAGIALLHPFAVLRRIRLEERALGLRGSA